MAYSLKPETEYSTCLENAVFLQLFYYKTATRKEIDFIVQEINGKVTIYQVCIDLHNEKTKQREITAIVEAAKELQLNEAHIIRGC